MRLWSLRVNIKHNLLMVGLNITNMHITLTPPGYHGTHDFLIQSQTLYYHDTPPPMVAARGCLPPGANVCFAVLANQIRFCNQRIFQDFGHRWSELTFEVPSSSRPSYSPSLYSPLSPSHCLPLLPSVKSRPFKSS